jgi:hypothetical protein
LTYNNCLLKRTPWESALELLGTIFRQALQQLLKRGWEIP